MNRHRIAHKDTEVENLPSMMPAFYVFIMYGYIEYFKLQPDYRNLRNIRVK